MNEWNQEQSRGDEKPAESTGPGHAEQTAIARKMPVQPADPETPPDAMRLHYRVQELEILVLNLAAALMEQQARTEARHETEAVFAPIRQWAGLVNFGSDAALEVGDQWEHHHAG